LQVEGEKVEKSPFFYYQILILILFRSSWLLFQGDLSTKVLLVEKRKRQEKDTREGGKGDVELGSFLLEGGETLGKVSFQEEFQPRKELSVT